MKGHHITLPIYNLSCAGETTRVERALQAAPGVAHVYVNPATEMAYVEYDPALADAAGLFSVLEREGYGPPARRPARQTEPPTAAKHTLDLRRMTLAGGLFLPVVYLLCILGDLLFPNVVQMYRVWELVLIGFNWAERSTLLLGFVEAFVYGAAGAWAFAALYNVLPTKAAETPAMTCYATQPRSSGQEGGVRA